MSESEPRLDVSRPTALRATGFVLTTLGAVLLGIGGVATWITVGIPNEPAHTPLRGTDLFDGRVVLGGAMVTLVAVFLSRLARRRRTRSLLAIVAVLSGLASLVLGVAFITSGEGRGAVVDAVGIPPPLWARFGVFHDLGPGPYLAVIGGLLCVAGAILTFVWARRVPETLSSADEVSPDAASG